MNMDYTLMLCGKDAFSFFLGFFVDLLAALPYMQQLGCNFEHRRKWGDAVHSALRLTLIEF